MTTEQLKKANALSNRITRRSAMIKSIEGCSQPEIELRYNCDLSEGQVTSNLWIKLRPGNPLWDKIIGILKEDLEEAQNEFNAL